MATLITIRWRDIPLQVIARDGRQAHKLVLPARFQTAADKSAMQAGLQAAGDYVGEMRREARECGADLEAEAGAEVARIEATFTSDVLARLVEAGGVDSTRRPGQEVPT